MKKGTFLMHNIKKDLFFLFLFISNLFFSSFLFLSKAQDEFKYGVDYIYRTFHETQKLLRYLGSIIEKAESIDQILIKESLYLNLDLWPNSYISIASEEGIVYLTGKHGVVKDNFKSITHRSYYSDGKHFPKTLQISKIEGSLFSQNFVIPTAMYFNQTQKPFFLLLGLRLDHFKKNIGPHINFSFADRHDINNIKKQSVFKKRIQINENVLIDVSYCLLSLIPPLLGVILGALFMLSLYIMLRVHDYKIAKQKNISLDTIKVYLSLIKASLLGETQTRMKDEHIVESITIVENELSKM